MPIIQDLNGPGLTQAPAEPVGAYHTSTTGDSYTGSSVYDTPRMQAISDFGGATEALFGTSRVAQLGLGAESAYFGQNLKYSDPYPVAQVPLGTSPGSLGSTPSGSLRTGSFDLNFLDPNETVAQITGEGIGRSQPMMGEGSGSTDLVSTALQAMNAMGTIPSKLLDNWAIIPFGVQALLGVQNSAQPKQADGTDWYNFQSSPNYWQAIANATDDQLKAAADGLAASQVNGYLQQSYSAKLLSVFQHDRASMTGMSSGNPQVDYLAKMQLQQIIASGNDTLARIGSGIGQGLTVVTDSFPIVGDALTQWVDPVKPETEAAWARLSPSDRLDLIGKNQLTTSLAGLAWMIPILSGMGAVLNVARSGMLGSTAIYAAGAAGASGDAAAGTGALYRVAATAAQMFGRQAAVEGDVLASMAKAAEITNRVGVKAYDVYDTGLRIMNAAMAGGLALGTANWALEHANVQYASTLGRRVDESAVVSSSPFAAYLDQIGMFASGTFGARTLLRATGETGAWIASKAGYADGPYVQMHEDLFGGSRISGPLMDAIGRTRASFDQTFADVFMSHVSEYTSQRFYEMVARSKTADEAKTALREMEQVRDQMTGHIAGVIKASLNSPSKWTEGLSPTDRALSRVGLESWRARQVIETVKRQGREMMDDVTRYAKSQSGSLYWTQELDKLGIEGGYSVEGFKDYIRHVAKQMEVPLDETRLSGYKTLDDWEKAANGIRSVYYDHAAGKDEAIWTDANPPTETRATIVRQGHLSTQHDAAWQIAVASGDPAARASVRKSILEGTPEGRALWARYSKGAGDAGLRGPDSVSDGALTTMLQAMHDTNNLMDYRVDGGTPGSYNDFHRWLQKGGVYDLAYPSSVDTALGAEKAQYEFEQRSISEWNAQHDAVVKAVEAADKKWADLRAEKQDALNEKYMTPIDKRLEAAKAKIAEKLGPRLHGMNSRAWDALTIPTKGNAAAYAKEVEALKAENAAGRLGPSEFNDAASALRLKWWDRSVTGQYEAFDKLWGDRMTEAGEKIHDLLSNDKEIQAAWDASEKAQAAWDAKKNEQPPIFARVGRVEPAGFEAVPEKTDFGDPLKRRLWDERVARERNDDPEAGKKGWWHVTTAMTKVLAKGLLDRTERVMVHGAEGSGLGGGNVGVSLTSSELHARAVFDRVSMAIRAAHDGSVSWDEIFTYYRKQPMLDTPVNVISQGVKAGEAFSHPMPDGSASVEKQFDDWFRGRGVPVSRDIADALDDLKTALHIADKGGDQIAYYEVFDANGEFAGYKDPVTGEFAAKSIGPWKKYLREQEDGWLTAKEAERDSNTHDPESPEAWAKLQELVQHHYEAVVQERFKGSSAWSLNPGETLTDEIIHKAATYQAIRGLDQATVLKDEYHGRPGQYVNLIHSWPKMRDLDPAEVGIVRVSVRNNPSDISALGNDQTETQVPGRDLFVHRPPLDQPFDTPVEDITRNWHELGVLNRPVSWTDIRNPDTGEIMHVQTPFNHYPTSADAIALGSRSWVAHKMDSIFHGFRSWKLGDAQFSQTMRLILERYPDATPEQAAEFIRSVNQMAFERWGPSGARGHMTVALGPQAAAIIRSAEVDRAGARIFGGHEVRDETIPAQMRRADGTMETPDWSKLFADGYRQGWTLNFTAGLTSRFKSMDNPLGYVGTLLADWLVPYLRYAASPIFKTSELVESKAFNEMAGVTRTSPEMRAMFAREAGVGPAHGQLHAEASVDEMAKVLGAATLPTAEELAAMTPDGLGSLGIGPHALAAEWSRELEARATRKGASATLRDAWRSVKDPTPFKDAMASDATVAELGKDLPVLIQKFDPQTYSVLHDELKVPDNKIAQFIVEDRSLLQKWLDAPDTQSEAAAFKALTDHSSKYAGQPDGADPFFATEAYQSATAMLRVGARAAQTEAFGVHYFGSYRSAFERSINHPVLGVYPASWAYKAAREWFRFLYDNGTFGEGALRLGMAPASWLQQFTQAQKRYFAQNADFKDSKGNPMTLDDWMNKGPLSRWFFLANLLMPGDWSSIPFPMSRSIRTALRGDLSPVDHLQLNMFGPQNRGGIGVLRDADLSFLGLMQVWGALQNGDKASPWDNIVNGLNADGTAKLDPALHTVTSFPTNALQSSIGIP